MIQDEAKFYIIIKYLMLYHRIVKKILPKEIVYETQELI